MSPAAFCATLLRWYAGYGRDLPWRHTRDPYAIWLSEVILQQTRISQGTAYWLRFMHAWPTVEALAAATEDEVLKHSGAADCSFGAVSLYLGGNTAA